MESSSRVQLLAHLGARDCPCSADQAEPRAVAIQGLQAETGAGRLVLKGIDALIPAGAFCAVMGSSGSGKTTLIKALAGVASGLAISGRAMLSGAITNRSSGGIAYLPQNEELLQLLTPRETIRFAASLRHIADPARASNLLLQELCLEGCADTTIGTVSGHGISGGERRRVSLALRLLQPAELLCADEPTSGLDSRSASIVVAILRRTAEQGCTVVCSIHQPRREILVEFGHLLLLSDGQLTYSGLVEEAAEDIGTCAGLGPCPAAVNPADFIIDASALDRTSPHCLASSTERVGRLAAKQKSRLESSVDLAAACAVGLPLLGKGKKIRRKGDGQMKPCRLLQETRVLCWRAMVYARRDRLLLLAVVLQNLMFGLVFGAMNWQLSTASLPDIHSRLALIYITPALSGFFVLSANLYILLEQIAVFDDEYQRDGLYSSAALVLSQFLAALPLNILAPLPMFLLVYFMAGLQTETFAGPAIFFSLLVLVRIHSSALAVFFTSVVPRRSFALSAFLANTYFLLCIFTGGFLTPIASLPSYMAPFRWIAFTFYGFRWNASAQFSDLKLHIFGLQVPGETILTQLGFDAHDFLAPPLCLLALAASWSLLSVFAFSILVSKTVAKAAHHERHSVAGDELVPRMSGGSESDCQISVSPSSSNTRTICCGATLVLNEVSLEVLQHRYRGFIGPRDAPQQPGTKQILHNISAGFSTGTLTAVAGPSGAGKTSLLSVLAGRVGGSAIKLGGEVSLDGYPVVQAQLRDHVALVGQEDVHLPGLTVQETISYHVQLRLPHESAEAKQNRTRTLVDALGLQGCLLTRVGLPAKGGISGGERRRLSIFMACLGNPAVLLLDEPTTGLDALAAQQLGQLLCKLAQERGQTLVCTLHQPRADLMLMFDRLLLMGAGGRILWDGVPGQLGAGLGAIGLQPPPGANMLDAAMDAVADVIATEALHDTWAKSVEQRLAEVQAGAATGMPPRNVPQRCPSCVAFRILLARSLRNFARQPEMIWSRCAQVVIFAIVLVPIYAPLGNSQASITSRIGLLYQSLGLLFAGTLNNMAVFPIERDVLLREAVDGLYSTLPFLLMYSLVEMTLGLTTSILAGITIVQATGLRSGFAPQTTFIAVLFASLMNGESIGIMLNSVVLHAGFSVNAINGFCATLQLMAGFMANSLPKPLALLNFLSPQRYACRALAASQFTADEAFACDGPSPVLCQPTGLGVLQALGLEHAAGHVLANLAALAVCCAVYRALSLLVLIFRVRKASQL